MKSRSPSVLLILSAMTVAVAADGTHAQTPAQMEYERQQREYRQQQEQQRLEQQRQQQLMQDNARRQQEESSRLNAPAGQGGGAGTPASRSAVGGSQGAAQAASAARAKWEKRPPLAADHNPLLGRWKRPDSTRTDASDPFAGLVALAKGGLCEVLFGGGGVFEFRPDRLVGMDEQTREQELDTVEYRGDAKHVVVLPKTTLKLIEFDFDGPNRVNWTGQNCTLVRAGPPSVAAGAAPAVVANAAQSTARSGTNSGGVLALSVGTPSPSNNVTGRKLWVLKQDAQVALIKGGLTSTPDGSVLQNWMRACTARAAACEKGALALNVYSIGIATTDANGRAQTPFLPAGRYWVLSDAKVDNKRLMWNEPVDIRSGEASLTLDQRNAMPVD